MKCIGCVLFFLIGSQFCSESLAADTVERDLSSPARYETNEFGGFICSISQDGIFAGVRIHEGTPLDIDLRILPDTNANRHRLWIAPPQFQRAEFFLYDSSNKLVPFLATYNPVSKKYTNLSEVPKNVHNVYKGIMGIPFAMPYDQVSLTNVFQIKQGGDYKLVVKARIMKINHDLSLSLIEFPPVYLKLHLDQPPSQ